MAIDQVAYRGRGDSVGLNDEEFTFGPSTAWTQGAALPFRVRLAASGSGTIAGRLEFSTDGTAFANVTDVSGTVQAARSANFSDGAATSSLLTDPSGFKAGYADAANGAAGEVVLSSAHTEYEFCVQMVPGDVSAGGTLYLRLAGLGTYSRTAQVVIGGASRDRVRLKIGDTVEGSYKLTDVQIDQCIADWPDNLDLAAANAAEAIAAKYADGFNFAEDGQTFNRRERFEHYSDLAKDLRTRGGHLVWP